MRPRTDAELVALAREGGREAAGELFSRYWGAAWRAAYAITGRRAMADDVSQDAFERAFAALSRFDERRPFAPWLHRIVVNRSLDLLRSERRLVGSESELEAAEWVDTHSGDAALLEAVSRLSEPRRVVLVLRYGLGYPPAVIAELLGLPAGTVHSRLARALDELRAESEVNDVERS
jgi:RNA polymerase sigma-70 factor, ECF subfamily